MAASAVRLAVAQESDVTRVLLEASVTAKRLGFSAVETQMIATTASELARNILKYAGNGEIALREVDRRGRTGLEIKAVDRGPGIADVDLALSDHFSTSGTLGLGLPGIKRMMDEFELKSVLDQGTTVTIRKWRS